MTKICLLSIPLNTVSGLSPTLIKKLNKFGLRNLRDLLLRLPIRYENRTKLYAISEALPGMKVTVQGRILNSDIRLGCKRILASRLQDNSGVLTLRFFNFNTAIKNSLSPGKWVTAYGKVRRDKNGNEIIHPEYSVGKRRRIMPSRTLTPIYPVIEGIRQSTLHDAVNQALKLLDATPIDELLPPKFSCGLMSLTDALKTLHHLPAESSLEKLALGHHPAQRRLILEELLAYSLSMLEIKTNIQKERARPLNTDTKLIQCFLNALPFILTNSQKNVMLEINQDLARDIPMMRLLQGDVGAGKTLVAALAALCAIGTGQQVALMAPTELLAEQHARNFRDWFTPMGIKVDCLTGKQNGKKQHMQRHAIAEGKIAMVVGTHAIFQDKVHFSRLALVIIDEQHRFGVHQRLSLWKKGSEKGEIYPHQLMMTATPIPRTLAMIAYANFDTSIIKELPPGRTPVVTVVISDARRAEIIQRIRKICLQERRQVYWVCTLIEESHILEAQAAKSTWRELKNALPELQIGLIYGRLRLKKKKQLMQDFKSGAVHVLVATTVIEIGVDVPNASLMIIDNPERLGLAQLHQLRGRVGRGKTISHCVLLYKSPLSKSAQERLEVLRNNSDGFIIAQRDLEIRGPGEPLGTRQTGNTIFRVVDFMRDQNMIPEVYRSAQYIHQHYPILAHALIKRWTPTPSSVFYTNV